MLVNHDVMPSVTAENTVGESDLNVQGMKGA